MRILRVTLRGLMVFKRKVYPPKHGLDLIGSSLSPSSLRRAVWPSSSSRRKLADGARRHPLSQLRRVWGYMLTSYVMLSTKSLGRGRKGREKREEEGKGRETSFLRMDKRMDALKKQGYIHEDWKEEEKETRERVNEGLRVCTYICTYVYRSRDEKKETTAVKEERPIDFSPLLSSLPHFATPHIVSLDCGNSPVSRLPSYVSDEQWNTYDLCTGETSTYIYA